MSDRIVRLTLPEPPSANRIWRNGRGRTYTDAAAHEFKLAARVAVLAAGIRRVVFPAGTAVAVTLTWYRQRKAGDLDNRVKVCTDAMNGLVWDDDKQVSELHLYRIDGQRPGRVELIVQAA